MLPLLSGNPAWQLADGFESGTPSTDFVTKDHTRVILVLLD